MIARKLVDWIVKNLVVGTAHHKINYQLSIINSHPTLSRSSLTHQKVEYRRFYLSET